MNTTLIPPPGPGSGPISPDNVWYEYVDPNRARELLANSHPTLRSIPQNSRPTVRYTHDMRTGRWQDDADEMHVDQHGRLVSGRKRLMAQIAANYSRWVRFVRVHEDARHVIDSGQTRSAGDALAAYGVKNANSTAALVRHIYSMRAIFRKRTAGDHEVMYKRNAAWNLSYDEILNFTQVHGGSVERCMHRVSDKDVRDERLALSSTHWRALYFILIECPVANEVIDEFFTPVITGHGVENGDHADMLRKKLKVVSEQLRLRGQSDEHVHQGMAHIVRQWNAFIKAEKPITQVKAWPLPPPVCGCDKRCIVF